MIARYGARAAANAAKRARALEVCGDRETARYWDLVRERIENFGDSSRRRGGYFSDDDADLVAAVRQAAFGSGVLGAAPGEDGEDDGAEDPPELADDPESSPL
jgi:hypothetical protein